MSFYFKKYILFVWCSSLVLSVTTPISIQSTPHHQDQRLDCDDPSYTITAACWGGAALCLGILTYCGHQMYKMHKQRPFYHPYDPGLAYENYKLAMQREPDCNVLGVSLHASQRDIRKAYHAKSLILHPDKPTGNAVQFRKLKAAYDRLTDQHKGQKL